MRMLLAVVFVFAIRKFSWSADANEARAREVIGHLLNAMKARNLEAALECTDAPFTCREREQSKILNDARTLKMWWTNRLAEITDADMLPTEVQKLIPFSELRHTIRDTAQRRAIEAALGTDGFVAIAGAPAGEPLLMLVRVNQGHAKVVGIGGR